MREALKFLGGSLVVYVALAACSSSRTEQPIGMTAGTTGSAGEAVAMGGGAGASIAGATGAGGMTAGGSAGTAGTEATSGTSGGPTDAGILDAIADAMIDPVPDADAQPTEPETAEADCDQILANGALSYRYAEFTFAGRTADDLALAGVLLHQVTQFPPSYSWAKAVNVHITTGKLLVLCELVASADSPQTVDFVRVVLP
jgi:hypothetical protein